MDAVTAGTGSAGPLPAWRRQALGLAIVALAPERHMCLPPVLSFSLGIVKRRVRLDPLQRRGAFAKSESHRLPKRAVRDQQWHQCRHFLQTGLAALWMVYAGVSWRVCWMAFALLALGVLVGNFVALGRLDKAPPARQAQPQNGPMFFQAVAIPLFSVAFVFGTISAIYIAFAVDYLAEAGGIPGLTKDTTPALVFVLYGIFGLTGLLTARLKNLIGLPWLLRSLMLAGRRCRLSLPRSCPEAGRA